MSKRHFPAYDFDYMPEGHTGIACPRSLGASP